MDKSLVNFFPLLHWMQYVSLKSELIRPPHTLQKLLHYILTYYRLGIVIKWCFMMFPSCFHALTSLRIQYWCIYEPKLVRIASKTQQIFNIVDKTLFLWKIHNCCDFQNRDIYLSKLIVFKKTPDLAFSDIILNDIKRWASKSKNQKSYITRK